MTNAPLAPLAGTLHILFKNEKRGFLVRGFIAKGVQGVQGVQVDGRDHDPS